MDKILILCLTILKEFLFSLNICLVKSACNKVSIRKHNDRRLAQIMDDAVLNLFKDKSCFYFADSGTKGSGSWSFIIETGERIKKDGTTLPKVKMEM